MRCCLITLALVASTTAILAKDQRHIRSKISKSTGRNDLVAVNFRSTISKSACRDELVAAKKLTKPPPILQKAYSLCGVATTAAWATVVRTTIRSNQPLGAMMPSPQHRIFASAGVLSAVPLIVSCYATLASAANDSWEQLSSPTCRRLNLALATAGIGSALWVGFAPVLTRIPGSNPLVSHQSYKGAMRTVLIGSYAASAAFTAGVWARSLPEDVRKNPLSWPGRIADGVAKSLVTLAPASVDDPVNVKYSLLAATFVLLTVLPAGPFPMAVVPSWTGRRTSRAFPAWTLLAAVSSYTLKEAAENGKLLADSTYRTLSSGLTSFGAVYLAAKVGAVFLDPSFPVHYKIVTQVIGYQALAAMMIGLTLRPDKAD